MADISSQPIPDFGQLLSSFGQNQANIGLTQAQTGASQASAGLMGAQTGLVQQQTQKAAFEVQMIKKAMSSLDNLSNTTDEKSGDQSSLSPTTAGIASSLNSKMFVDPMGPPGLQNYINATAWVNPAESQRAEEWRKMLVARQTAQNQNEATDIWQTSSALGDSNAGLEALLKTTRPGSYLNNVGKAIASDTTKSPEEKDAAAREAIKAAEQYSHQYTGRKPIQAGDQWVDPETGRPVGAPTIGLTAEQKTDFGKWINTPQTMTIDGRDTTIKPKDLGITSPQDVLQNRSVKFSVQPPSQQGPQPQNPAQVRASSPGGPGTSIPTGNATAGLDNDHKGFVNQLDEGFPKLPSNQKPNPDDLNQRSIYRQQAAKLAQVANQSSSEASETLASINRIESVLKTPGITTGPGSSEYYKMRTFMNQWFGTPAGQAPAYQVLSKFLNAEQMTGILKQFHGDGAQVRLGAYESRLIMEQLAANPQMTKEAINQMLSWQKSDAGYTLDKYNTAKAAIRSNKNVATFDTDYNTRFPKDKVVDTNFGKLKPAAPAGAEAEALANPKLMKDFEAKFGYVPSRPSPPTKEELGIK